MAKRKKKVDRSKIGRRSKRKGGTYERRVAALFTEFTGVNFRKVPSSGGFNKVARHVVMEQKFSGDIMCDDDSFLFSIEAKNQKVFSFISVLSNPDTAAFSSWWYQCTEDAKNTKQLPLLIFKPDAQKDYVALSKEVIKILGIRLNKINHFVLDCYRRQVKIKDNRTKETVKIKLPTPYIFHWKDLINHVDPRLFFGD